MFRAPIDDDNDNNNNHNHHNNGSNNGDDDDYDSNNHNNGDSRSSPSVKQKNGKIWKGKGKKSFNSSNLTFDINRQMYTCPNVMKQLSCALKVGSSQIMVDTENFILLYIYIFLLQ